MSKEVPLWAHLMFAAGVVGLCGVYHHFTTNNKDIVATVRGKYTTTNRVRRNRRAGRWETDYYIETDKGIIRDEWSPFDGKWSEGRIYDDVQPGHVYHFKASHSKTTHANNALQYTEVAKRNTPRW